MFEKAMALAEKGSGRRLLNTLSKKRHGLTRDELDRVLAVYRDQGLPKDVESLKTRRGILDDTGYDTMAEAVRINCCAEKFEAFSTCLRDLLTCGIKMNPAKMDRDNG
ncbi:MAG: hypothetical protein MI863_27350 [Desulfobacterales bacterium]|nr:hypothetical protein [Desulfobacterales bacterium]